MRKARWLADWRDSEKKPVFYHCISRVVERRFAFGREEKEKFRTNAASGEVHGLPRGGLLFDVQSFPPVTGSPPMLEGGLSDGELLKRLRAIYSEALSREW